VAESPTALNILLKRIRSLGPQVTTRTSIVLQSHFEKPGPSPFTLGEDLPRKVKR